jgi:hypothetical protein
VATAQPRDVGRREARFDLEFRLLAMSAPTLNSPRGIHTVSTITSNDGTQIYYKDWGRGPVVTFSHGWPLNADAWDGQLHFLAQQGFRVICT